MAFGFILRKMPYGVTTCPLSSAKAISGISLLKKYYRSNLGFKMGFSIIEQQNSISRNFYRLNLLDGTGY